VIRFVKLNARHIALLAPLKSEARIAHNFEQPRLSIPAPVAVKKSKSAQTGFLHHVLCVMLIANQPSRQVISRMQVWKNDFFKKPQPGFGATDGIVHRAGLR
jgi:hypothetical protein